MINTEGRKKNTYAHIKYKERKEEWLYDSMHLRTEIFVIKLSVKYCKFCICLF